MIMNAWVQCVLLDTIKKDILTGGFTEFPITINEMKHAV